MMEKILKSVNYLKKNALHKPRILIILGSGLGSIAGQLKEHKSFRYPQIPYFKKTNAPTHSGRLLLGKMKGLPVMLMQGRHHLYEGYDVSEVVYPVRVAAEMGVDTLITTNLSGAVNPKLKIGDFVVLKDHINLSGENPLVGIKDKNDKFFFTDMRNAYCESLREKFIKIAKSSKHKLTSGVLAFLKGPSFETLAEVNFLKRIGADCVGWSIVPEVIMAKALGMKVLAISLISDLAYAKDPLRLQDIYNVGSSCAKELGILLDKLCAELL